MIPNSPLEALGSHVDGARDLAIEVVQTRHGKAANGHDASESRYNNGFGNQWRDLLDDIRESFGERGYPPRKLYPGGYQVPLVNGCLLFVWRVPSAPNAVDKFASSPTRMSAFFSEVPNATLFDSYMGVGDFSDGSESDKGVFERVLAELDGKLPVVLVMVHSSPRQLTSIDWAVAELTEGKVTLHGEENIWTAETVEAGLAEEVEAFDSGAPKLPALELQSQDGPTNA